MKVVLFALFVALLMVGCGESIDLDDKETREKIIAEAIDWDEIVKRDQRVYDANDQTPLTGWVKMVHDNGQVGFLGLFNDGKLILALAWKPDGGLCPVTKIDEDGNGIVVSYDKDGAYVSRTTYKNGEEVETVVDWSKLQGSRFGKKYLHNTPFTGRAESFYGNGQKKFERNHKDGKEDGLYTSWYENGQKRNEWIKKEGIYHGPLTRWYENGQKELEANYKVSKWDGLRTEWYENGHKKIEANWKDGKVMAAKVWKPNGEKCPVTSVKDGNGLWIRYDEEGAERIRYTCKDGKIVYYKRFASPTRTANESTPTPPPPNP